MKKKETTEREIIKQIRQTLDNYEEPYVRGSWENFQLQEKKRRRKIFLRIASGIAACLLIGFTGLDYIQSYKSDLPKTSTLQSAGIIENAPSPAKNSMKESSTVATESQPQIAKVHQPGQKPVSKTGQKTIAVDKSAQSPVNLTLSKIKNDTLSKTASLALGITSQPAGQKQDSAKVKQDTSFVKTETILLADQAREGMQKDAAGPRRKVRFGINFSPGFAASQSAGTVNYMGGLSADIPLSSKFQLSTGLQVENQSVVKENPGIVSSATAPKNETKTELITLDVPLNFTWKFVTEKSHAYYVSAGLSSLVYLKQENMNTTYSQDLVPVSSLVNGQEVKSYNVVDHISVTQNSVTPDQAFDLAGRLNLMVGFEKKLTNRLFMHIEPYTKIPTSAQTEGSFNFTTSGINFKISF